MPAEYHCFGLDSIFEDDETGMNYVAYSVKNGEPIYSYYGMYVLKKFGRTDFIVSCEHGEDEKGNKRLEFMDLNIIANGSCVWTLKVHSSIDLSNLSEVNSDRYCAFTREDEDGFAVVHVLNSETVPSYFPGETIKLQMNGLGALDIHYYSDEDEYLSERQSDKHELMQEINTVMPLGFFSGKTGQEKSVSCVVGEVEKAYYGTFAVSNDEEGTSRPYIICRVSTQFGPLDLIHTLDQIDENDIRKIKKGSIVYGLFFLTGDAAIYEYDKGYICDYEHNLKALQYSLYSKKPERLKEILADDIIYYRDDTEQTIKGKENVLSYFTYVNSQQTGSVMPYIGNITEIYSDGFLKLGDRCIAFSYNDENVLDHFFKVEVNAEGKINRIYSIHTETGRFDPDVLLKNHSADLSDAPQYIEDAIINRAFFLGFLDRKKTDGEALFLRVQEAYKDNSSVVMFIKEYGEQTIHRGDIYEEPIFIEFFKQCIGKELSAFDSDDCNLILNKSGCFWKDFNYHANTLGKQKANELVKALQTMKVIAEEMIVQNKAVNQAFQLQNSLSLSYIDAKQYNEAIHLLQQMVVLHPLDPQAWNNLAFCYSMENRKEEAYRAYRKAYKLNNSSKSLLGMILALKDLERDDDVEYYCKEFKEKFNDIDLDAVLKSASN